MAGILRHYTIHPERYFWTQQQKIIHKMLTMQLMIDFRVLP